MRNMLEKPRVNSASARPASRRPRLGGKALAALACVLAACLCAGAAFATGEAGNEKLAVSDKASFTVQVAQVDEAGEATQEPCEAVEVPATGAKANLLASAADAKDEPVEASFQWQILVDAEAGVWTDIQGQSEAGVGLTLGMVSGALDADGVAQVRCMVTAESGEAVASDPVKVTVAKAGEGDGSVAAAAATSADQPAPVVLSGTKVTGGAAAARSANGGIALMDADSDVKQTYNIVINYMFENNDIVSDPYTANLAEGSSFSATVTFPTVQGYLPYVNDEQKDSIELNYTSVSENVTINVVYKPTNVNYTVIHYQQNVDNDQYTEVGRETKQGLTASAVPEVAKEYEGFYGLLYERPAIAADGSTVIEVYYDRYYYLMNFDMDGGYGTEPVYARYGAGIGKVADPVKAGYTFQGWSETKGGTTVATLPTTMPAKNKTYYAIWEPDATAKVTVVFWGENADDEGYSYLSEYTKETYLKPGGGFTYLESNMEVDGLDLSRWSFAKSDTITVAADGSSVCDVYCDRVEYAVQFYTRGDSPSEFTHLRIDAKWGAYVGDKWPTRDGSANWYVNPKQVGDSNPTQAKLLRMPVGGDKFYGPKTSGENTLSANYYVEKLDSTNSNSPSNYELHHTDTITGNEPKVTKDDKYDIDGFKTNDSLSTENGSKYDGAKFYYTRNSYKLTFNDQYSDVKKEAVKYEAPLSTYKDYVPEVPSAYEPGSVEFGGWYQNPQCTGEEYKLDEHKMPSSDVILYAKWVPVNHTVTFYLDKEAYDTGTQLETPSPITVPHGALATPTPVAPTKGDYDFVGWFYMDNGVEKAFDFANMQVRKDLHVYGKWSSNTLKAYTVQYVLKDDHSVKVADDLTGSGLAGTTKTFDAKGTAELHAAYQEGYFPTVQSQSLLLDIDSNNLTITFEYVQKEAVPYTVKYVEKGTGKSLADDKVVSDNRKAVVTETFKAITGYMPDAYQKRLVVTADGENILYFYYTKDTEHAYYKITHWTQNADDTTWTEHATSQAVGDIGTCYTASPMTIPGYTYKETEYVVNGNKLTDVTAEGAKLTGSGLEINLYYVLNEYPYQVRYLEQGSGTQLADPKNGTGKYGQTVSESAIDIDGYDKVDPTSATLSIRIDEGEGAPNLNVIAFYYKEQEVTINYVAVGPEGATGFGGVNPTTETVKAKSGTAQGSTPAAGDGYKFVGWFKDEACTQPVDADWIGDANKLIPRKTDGKNVAATYYAKFEADTTSLTITKKADNGTTFAGGDSFVFKVTGSDGFSKQVVVYGEDSVTIDGLKVGETYTVAEDAAWSWRYGTTTFKVGRDDVKTGLSADITLDANASSNTVTFNNAKTKNNWLDFSDWCRNLFTGDSSGKTEYTLAAAN